MAIVQGIIDATGGVVRAKGAFKVLSRTKYAFRVQVTGQKTGKAFVLATPWRSDNDFGPQGVTAAPDPNAADVMIFAVVERYGLSFRIEP